MANWGNKLAQAFSETGDDFNNMETTLTNKELIQEFDDGFGGAEGVPFTCWGEKYVYFPVVYDGAEWVGYAPRNVCDIKTEHVGGH